MHTLTISRTQVRNGLAAVAVLLLVASTLLKSMHVAWGNDYIFGLLRVFWVDSEGNLPTWFSSTMLLGSAALALIIGASKRSHGPYGGWYVVAGLMLLMAVDESASIHEISSDYAVRADGFGLFPAGGAVFAWVVFALPFVVAGCWLGMRFWRTLEAAARNRLGAGLAIWMGGALGIEALTGQMVGFQPATWTYLALATLEEGAEMMGAVLFVDGLLVHLANSSGRIALHFVNRDDGIGPSA